MKKLLQIIIPLFFLVQIQLWETSSVLAQSQPNGFEFVYSNIKLKRSNSTETTPSLSKLVFVDTDRVFTIIESSKLYDNVLPYPISYLSIHDQAGNQIAMKPLNFNRVEVDTRTYDNYRCNNIEKLNNGNYIITGIQLVQLPRDSFQLNTFYYIFNRDGDSVLFQAFPKPTPYYAFTTLDFTKSPTGELISLQDEIVTLEDSFMWVFISEVDSVLIKYQKHFLVLTKHNPDGEKKWSKEIPNITLLRSNWENLYDITISPDAQHYIISSPNVWKQADSNYFIEPVIFVIDSSGNFIRNINIPRTTSTDSFIEIVRASPKFSSLTTSFFQSSYFLIKTALGKDGSIYYMVIERAPKYDLVGWTPYYLNQYIHYGKMDLEGNIIWSRLFDINRPMQYSLNTSRIDISPNGDIFMALDAAIAPNQGEKNNIKGIIIKASSEDGAVKWWKDLRTFNVHEDHLIKDMMINPVNGKIGIVGSISCKYDLSPEEWNNADAQRQQMQGLQDVAWLVVLDSNGRRCTADSLYGEIIPPDCRHARLLVDPQLEIDAAITLYPNPTKDWIIVAIQDLKEIYPGEVRCEVNDMLGRKLQSHILTYDRTNLDFTPYAPGIFMVNIFHNGKLVFSGKVRKE